MEMKKSESNVRVLAECAVMLALATVLSLIKIYEAPLGGSVTLFSMSPILLISYLYGIRKGLVTAFAYSVIQLLLGLSSVAWVPSLQGIFLCILFDYILPFSLLGLAGLWRYSKLSDLLKLFLGSIFVCFLRFGCHVISGAVVWYSITKEGQWNTIVNRFGMWTYSLVYNSQFMVPEIIITLISIPAIYAIIIRLKKKNQAKA